MKMLFVILVLGCNDKESPENTVATPPTVEVVAKDNAVAETPKPETKTELPKTEPASVKEAPTGRSGVDTYNQVCSSCHMPTGMGLPGAYPPLAGSDWLAKDSSILIRIVLHGLLGEIEVSGNKFNNVMAAWGSQLTDIEVANVLTHVRSSWGNELPAITAEEVAAVRKQYEGHAPWTASELVK